MPGSAVPSLPPEPPRRHVPRGADLTREKLLQATHELIFESGGAEPSVSQICQRAAVQVGMVSYCFGGKTQLLDALVERGLAEGVAELERLAAADLPPSEKLRAHVAGVIRIYWRFPYGSQLAERLHRGDGSARHMTDVFAVPALAFYRELIREGRERGEFREVDPTFLLFTIIGACEFLFTARSWIEDAAGESVDDALVERFTEHTVAVLERGIAADPPRPRADRR